MKASTSLALIASAVAITSVNGGSLLKAVLRPRGIDEEWGGINITASVLEVYNSISHPTCNATDYCVQLATYVVPRCLQLQGTAGCWCTLHDPIHYCAICMSSPPDNTTTADQTQAATEGHANYHKGCAAWQAYLNASAAGSLTTSVPPTTSAPLPTVIPSAQTVGSSKSSVSTGAIIGAVIGGVAFLVLVLAITFVIWTCLKNQAERERRQAEAAADEKRRTYHTVTDMGDKIPNTPPPQLLPYQTQPLQGPAGHHSQPISPQSAYSGGAQIPPNNLGARPDSMFSDTAASQSAASYQAMRQGSIHDVGSLGIQPMPQQPMPQPGQTGQYHIANELGSQRGNLASPPPPFSTHPPQG